MSEAPPSYAPPTERLTLDPEDLGALGLEFEGGQVLPVVHGRIECAWLVRTAIERLRPTAIAVEFPESLQPAIRRAIDRLPLLSVVHWPSPREHDRPIYLPIEPADPMIEAIRYAGELGLPVHFVDRDVDGGGDPGKLPDPLAMEHVGAAPYLEHALAAADRFERGADDDAREATMARQIAATIAGARAEGRDPRILVIVSLHRARPLAARLREAADDAPPTLILRRRHLEGVSVSHLAEASSQEILAELPFFQAAHERARSGAAATTDDDAGEEEDEDDASLAQVVRLFERRARDPAPPPEIDDPRDPATEIASPPAASAPGPLCGRIGLLYALCREARARYRRSLDADLRPGTIAALLRYACRYALTEGQLGPDLYHLVIAARGFVDDHFAHELWEAAAAYPWQRERPEIPTIELGLRDLHGRVRTVRFRPRVLPRRRTLRILGPGPRERRPGEWAERFTDGICSFPPEDLAIEAYGDHLRRRADRMIHAAATRTVRFSGSLEAGVDLRETVRQWHEGALYVRQEHALRDHAGPVVVIFDDEPLDVDAPKYPWQMTWQGESEEEGDMALYATDPMERLVGPGIGRALYGGFVLHRPSGTMFGVWDDPYFEEARTKAEVLLLAALDHARARVVVHVAAKPPPPRLRRLAARMDRKIVHVPLGQLSPGTLRRVRTLHVLSDPEARSTAHLYIRG
ncbi:MAG: hypothetical protein R3B09_34535 [Nannocystaceae bacterium]